MTRLSPRRSGAPGAARPRGMTLIEALVTLVILVLVGIGIAQLLASSRESQQTILGQNDAQKWAQKAVDSVVDTLRATASVQSGDAAQITGEYSDGSSVTYYVAGGSLLRDRYDYSTGQTHAGEVVSAWVAGALFRYYLRSGNAWVETPNPPLAQSVLVSVTVAEGKGRTTYTSLVKLRNKT